ncbi:MAG TPA: PQQ-binding-like beta-propeller repeat protein [Gaiellaceae bacterium]|nr:PQQ-binding-like beta-propeller repeat protein [Gaiellaceae bacterium]
MRRLSGVLLAALVAGCGGGATVGRAPAPPPAPAPAPKPVRAVLVTVVDGDTHARVRGAVVRVGGRAARTDARGVARIPLRRHVALVTRVRARGYLERELRLPFRRRPRSTVRLYRPALQWPVYGVDARRTQAQTEIRLRPPFRVLWSRGTGSLTEFPAVVSEGVAYIGNFHGTVTALAMANGRLLWRRETHRGKMASSPAVWGDRLVVHGMDGAVRVLDRATGRLLARYRVGSPVESSPIVRGGVDYFGAWDGRVYALDLRRRRLRWTFSSGCKITSSASIAGGTLYIGDYCGRLLALSPATGRERWSGAVGGRIYGTPAVAGGRVFVPSSTGGSLTAFSTGGRFLWRRTFGSYVYSSPAVWRGRVFFGAYDGVFRAVSAASGRTLWSVPTGGAISGAAVVVAGVAYAGSFAHRIVGVDAASGRVLLDFPHGAYVPVSGDGGRLLLHGYSRLYAVAPR